MTTRRERASDPKGVEWSTENEYREVGVQGERCRERRGGKI